jgi:hypothetical protein
VSRQKFKSDSFRIKIRRIEPTCTVRAILIRSVGQDIFLIIKSSLSCTQINFISYKRHFQKKNIRFEFFTPNEAEGKGMPVTGHGGP